MIDPQAIKERGFLTPEEADELEPHLEKMSVKVQLIDSDPKGVNEGIWVALLTDEDMEKYHNDTSHDELLEGVLTVHPLMFFPNRTWGMVIPMHTRSKDRPKVYERECVERFEEAYPKYAEAWMDTWQKGNEEEE